MMTDTIIRETIDEPLDLQLNATMFAGGVADQALEPGMPVAATAHWVTRYVCSWVCPTGGCY